MAESSIERDPSGHGAIRLLRGWTTAFLATTLAALSHSAAGLHSDHAAIDPLVWVLTLALSGLVCTMMVGQRASGRLVLWRNIGAVGLSQIIFHLAYSVGGTGHGTVQPQGATVPGHENHVESISLSGSETATAASGLGGDGLFEMFLAHGGAALATIWLINRGEATLLKIVDYLLVPGSRRIMATYRPPEPISAVPVGYRAPALNWLMRICTSVSRRGPPAQLLTCSI